MIARARAKRGEMAAAWTSLSAEMPGLIAPLMSRIDTLQRAKKLPRGMDARRVREARASLGAATDAWNAAIEAHRAGNVPAALTKGREAKAGLEKAAKLVGRRPGGNQRRPGDARSGAFGSKSTRPRFPYSHSIVAGGFDVMS